MHKIFYWTLLNQFIQKIPVYVIWVAFINFMIQTILSYFDKTEAASEANQVYIFYDEN